MTTKGTKGKEKRTHYDERDVLRLSKASIIESQRSIQKDTIWSE